MATLGAAGVLLVAVEAESTTNKDDTSNDEALAGRAGAAATRPPEKMGSRMTRFGKPKH